MTASESTASSVVGISGDAELPGRNAPCPCGSGAKWKRCHGRAEGPPDDVVAILGGRARAPGYVWDGKPWDGPMCVFLDAGAGDAIHAFRHVPEMMYKDTCVVARPSMARLFRWNLHSRADLRTTYPIPEYRWRTTSLELLTLATRGRLKARRAARYLRAPTPAALGRRKLHVGLCVRGDSTQGFDRWRSIHDERILAPLYALDGVEIHRLENADGRFKDWADTADLVASLRLVISVDTGVAHLAGALGVETWVLDRCAGEGDPGPDDRWEDGFLQPGPLYPGARTFRQARRLEWAPVVARAAEELQKRL